MAPVEEIQLYVRRLEHGPDVKVMAREALREAARNAGAEIRLEGESANLEA